MSQSIETKLIHGGVDGVLAGSSSDAALSATRKLANRGAAGNIVVIMSDRGDRYFSKNLL